MQTPLAEVLAEAQITRYNTSVIEASLVCSMTLRRWYRQDYMNLAEKFHTRDLCAAALHRSTRFND